MINLTLWLKLKKMKPKKGRSYNPHVDKDEKKKVLSGVSKCAKQQSIPIPTGRTANWHNFSRGQLSKIINCSFKICVLFDQFYCSELISLGQIMGKNKTMHDADDSPWCCL